MNFRISKIRRVAVGAVCLLLAFSSALADVASWSGSSGGWNDAANWSGTLPSISGSAVVDNGGTANLKTGVSGTTGVLLAGFSGTGSVAVSGGQLATIECALGSLANSRGTVTVTSGTWTNADVLIVGRAGTGSLVINSGMVSDQMGYVGYAQGSSGNVTVTGGMWANSFQLYIGMGGTGTLTISGSGVVNVASQMFLGNGSTLNLGTGGQAGTLNAANILCQSGTGTVNFNQSGNYTFASALVGNVNINAIGSGTTTLTGISMISGSVTIAAGKLKVDGNLLPSGGMHVAQGAALSGTGAVNGVTTVDGLLNGSLHMENVRGSGLVSPGDMATPGIMNAATLDPTGGLDFAFTFTLANANPLYGNVVASGNAILCATPNAALTRGNTISFYLSEAALGDTFQGGFFSSLSAAELEALIKNANFAYYVQDVSGSILYNGVRYSALNESLVALSIVDVTGATFASGPTDGSEMKVTVVPEPVTWALFLGGLGLLFLWQRRHRTV